MTEQITDARGDGYAMRVLSGGELAIVNTPSSDPTTITNLIGSYVYTGDLLGSMVRFSNGSEFVKVFTYSGTDNVLVGIGSWSAI